MLKRVSVVIALLAIALAAPAMGDGSGSTARSGPGRPYPLKDRDCVSACRVEKQACLQDARDASAPCFEGCKPLVDAASAACKADPASDSCKTAAGAARACLAPCNDVFRPVARMCLDNGNECVRACPFVGEPPCLAACRADDVHCLADARQALTTCRKGCDDEIEAVRTACASDRTSTACKAARDALQACLAPCRGGVKDDLDKCGSALDQCVHACPATGGSTP